MSTEEALSSGWSGEALENLLEQPPERLPLLGVQLTEHVVLDLGERAAGPVERLAPSGRDLDHVPAPVLGVAAAEHAAASWALITIEVGDGQLRFEVGDDGCGIDEASRRAGSGLQNMRDRVEALSGTVSVRSGPAGTVVQGAMLTS